MIQMSLSQFYIILNSSVHPLMKIGLNKVIQL